MAIIVHELYHTYNEGTANEKQALHDVNLKIEDGEMIGLIGHTGSGKSTLIQHLNGLLKPTAGGIYYNGEDIHDEDYSLKKLRSKIGLVFQYPEYQLFESSVIEDVRFGPKNIGLDPLKVDLNAFQALKQVGIGEELLDVSPLELSGGQKRRVAIAGVLAMEPEVLILDEPTAALDPLAEKEMYEKYDSLCRGKTALFISHRLASTQFSDRILFLRDGEIVESGSHQKLLETNGEYAHMFEVQSYYYNLSEKEREEVPAWL